jgi:hypothetical protein
MNNKEDMYNSQKRVDKKYTLSLLKDTNQAKQYSYRI